MERFVNQDVRRSGAAGCARDGVSSPVELRSYAVDCARLARSATALQDKARLLNMARAWTELADRIERLGQTGTAPGNQEREVPLAGSPPPNEG